MLVLVEQLMMDSVKGHIAQHLNVQPQPCFQDGWNNAFHNAGIPWRVPDLMTHLTGTVSDLAWPPMSETRLETS